jgi:hypothetical protein
LGCVNLDTVVDEELSICTVSKVQDVAAFHAKQLFELATLEGGQVRHAPPSFGLQTYPCHRAQNQQDCDMG